MIQDRTIILKMISAMSGLRSGLLVLMIAVGGSAPGGAEQFSAELVRIQSGVTALAGHLRVAGDKVRIESPELPDGFFLIDGAKPAAYFVRPALHLFMDARQSSPLVRLFVPVDPDNPCRQWQAMADLAGLGDRGDWRCEFAGTETIGGHEMMTYRASSAAGAEFVGWIDGRRKFPQRIKTTDGTLVAVENIRDETQAAELFELPKGSRKFDPQTLIERIKQSDVWAAAPKTAP
jgi:hypothetical protein